MKLNKKTQDLLNEFELRAITLDAAKDQGITGGFLRKIQGNYDSAEKELNRHLFKLEQRVRLYRRAN